MEWRGGVEWSGMEWSEGVECRVVEWSGVDVEWSGWSGLEWGGV